MHELTTVSPLTNESPDNLDEDIKRVDILIHRCGGSTRNALFYMMGYMSGSEVKRSLDNWLIEHQNSDDYKRHLRTGD